MLERDKMTIMDILELIKYRRSIRRYTDRQVSEQDLLKTLEAGAYAPNAGGQRSRFVACQNRTLNEAIGKLNIARFDRSRLVGGFVSKEQPSSQRTKCALFTLYIIPVASTTIFFLRLFRLNHFISVVL